jgi:hypothetical protein
LEAAAGDGDSMEVLSTTETTPFNFFTVESKVDLTVLSGTIPLSVTIPSLTVAVTLGAIAVAADVTLFAICLLSGLQDASISSEQPHNTIAFTV